MDGCLHCLYLVDLGFYLSALLWREGNVRIQSKMTSVVLSSRSFDGWVKQNIFYVPQIILIFTYNKCNLL